MEGIDPMTRADHQKGIDAAEKAVVVAAKAWDYASQLEITHRNVTLSVAVRYLEILESKATRALSGRGETTVLAGVHYRGRAVPSPVEKRQCPKCDGCGTVVDYYPLDCPVRVTCHYCAGHGKVGSPPEAEEELNAEHQKAD